MPILALIFSLLAQVVLPVVLQIFLTSLGVYYGMKRFKRWEEKEAAKTYEALISKAKDRKKR